MDMRSEMTLQIGDVVRYGDSGWCQHGIAMVKGSDYHMWAADTYWDDTSHEVPLECLEGKDVIGNIITFSPHVPYPYEYEDYAEKDKFYIPIGGGSSQEWVRKDTPPDPEKVATRLRYKLQLAHNKVRSAAQDVEYRTKELMKFEHKLAEYAPKG
jgi:hypothetical protein